MGNYDYICMTNGTYPWSSVMRIFSNV